jgi:hypothetical protein
VWRVNNPTNFAKGEAMAWLLAHTTHQGDECLIWPFSRQWDGRGSLGFMGQRHHAHRMMCILAHGTPPTPRHRAAHSCGKGHEGCVHPGHLEWKTNSENQLDRRVHGTVNRNPNGRRGKLTHEQVREIRALKGKMTQIQLGAMFGVNFRSIGFIHQGRTWKNVN